MTSATACANPLAARGVLPKPTKVLKALSSVPYATARLSSTRKRLASVPPRSLSPPPPVSSAFSVIESETGATVVGPTQWSPSGGDLSDFLPITLHSLSLGPEGLEKKN